jgi:hypothetical protein
MVITDKDRAAGRDIPWGWAVSYERQWHLEWIVYPWGIHLFPRAWWRLRNLWGQIRYWWSESDYRRGFHDGVRHGKNIGHREGFEEGKATMLSFMNMEMERFIEERRNRG